MIPGSNVLQKAFKLIFKDEVSWQIFSGQTENDIGMLISTYEDPVIIFGSMQPVQKNKYEQYGLDFTKVYYNFFTTNNILGLNRDYSGDRATFKGIQFQVESGTEWFKIDGWNQALLSASTQNNA